MTGDFYLNKLPYYDRQMITIVPDEIKRAEEEIEIKKQIKNGDKDSKTIDYFQMVSKFVVGELWIQLGIELLKMAKEIRKRGVQVLTISASDSALLKFPPGHPRKKILYVGNPAAKELYYPFSEFHRLMFESKFSEAIMMLMALGADNLIVERLEGWGYELSSSLNVPVHPKINAKAENTGSKSNDKRLLFEAKLSPIHDPHLPNNLSWFYHEPTWQMIADGRLKYGLREFSLNVSYKDDYGINSKLKTEIDKSGFEIGASFQTHKETVWNIKGNFNKKIAE
jgi:hypothetical protein